MIHWLQTAINTYLLHPLHGNGYQWHSGAGSDLQEITLLGLFVGLWHRHNCHHRRCFRVVRHGKTHCPKHEAEAKPYRNGGDEIGVTTTDPDGNGW